MADYENNNQTNEPTAESGAETQNTQNQNNFAEQQNQAPYGAGYANPQAAYYANPQPGTYFTPRQAEPNPQGTPAGNAYYAQPNPQNAPAGNAYSAQQAAYYPPNSGYPIQPIEQKANVWYALLSFFVPIAGLIIFLVERESRPKTAKASGICALVSYITRIIAYVILCAVMFFATETLFDYIDDVFDDTDYSYSYDSDSNLVTDTIADYKCIVKSAEYTKDYQGNDAVVITYEFTNNSEYPTNFLSALYTNVYQNSSIIYETMPAEGAADITFNKTVAPGATAEIKAIYKLEGKDRDINVEIHNNEDWSDGDYIDEYLTMSGAID